MNEQPLNDECVILTAINIGSDFVFCFLTLRSLYKQQPSIPPLREEARINIKEMRQWSSGGSW